MLSTVLFICGAYGLYACYTWGWQRQPRNSRALAATTTSKWLPRLMLAGGLAGSLGLVFWLSPPSSDRTLSLAAFLGLAPPEIRLASTYAPVREQLPVKLSPSGKQPAYTLLYPETPVAEIAPPKKPAVGKPLRQGKMKAMVPPTGKHAKVAVQPNKKEKTQTKAKSKKKKPEPQPRGAASLHVASSP